MDFCYQPLDPRVKEIRIFKIHPRNSSCIRKSVGSLTKARAIPLLELTLKHVRLDKAGLVFNALSYTWGEPSPTRKILINNQIFKIRENLWHFLNIAAHDPEIHNTQIWVDQISINQASIEERNHQVGFMGHIYTQASKVFMWLGTSTQYCDRTMIHLSNGCISRVLEDPTRMDSEVLLKRMMLYSSSEFTALFKRPYWRRLWIIQEIVLGHADNRTVLCGAKKVSWQQFKSELAALFAGLDALLALPQNSQAKEHLIALELKTIRALINAKSFGMGRPERKLCEVVCTFKNSICTDRRDGVFGLLGLVTEDERVEVDYHMSLESLIIAIFVKGLKTTSNDRFSLDELQLAQRVYMAVAQRWTVMDSFGPKYWKVLLHISKGRIPLGELLNMIRFRGHMIDYDDFVSSTLASIEAGTYHPPAGDGMIKMVLDIASQIPHLNTFIPIWDIGLQNREFEEDDPVILMFLDVVKTLYLRKASSSREAFWYLAADRPLTEPEMKNGKILAHGRHLAWKLGLLQCDGCGERVAWVPGGWMKTRPGCHAERALLQLTLRYV